MWEGELIFCVVLSCEWYLDLFVFEKNQQFHHFQAHQLHQYECNSLSAYLPIPQNATNFGNMCMNWCAELWSCWDGSVVSLCEKAVAVNIESIHSTAIGDWNCDYLMRWVITRHSRVSYVHVNSQHRYKLYYITFKAVGINRSQVVFATGRKQIPRANYSDWLFGYHRHQCIITEFRIWSATDDLSQILWGYYRYQRITTNSMIPGQWLSTFSILLIAYILMKGY